VFTVTILYSPIATRIGLADPGAGLFGSKRSNSEKLMGYFRSQTWLLFVRLAIREGEVNL